MQYVDSWYCWRKENILQLCFFVSTLPSTIFDWRYFTTCFLIFDWKYFGAILQRNIFPDIWMKVFHHNIAEQYFSWCLIESISVQYQREIFVLMFDWKYFAAIPTRKICPDIWMKVFLCNIKEKYLSWYLNESISVQHCREINQKYFAAFVLGWALSKLWVFNLHPSALWPKVNYLWGKSQHKRDQGKKSQKVENEENLHFVTNSYFEFFLSHLVEFDAELVLFSSFFSVSISFRYQKWFLVFHANFTQQISKKKVGKNICLRQKLVF